MLFCGNITHQPAYLGLHHRVVGELGVSDRVMSLTCFIGTNPEITKPMREYVVEQLSAFFNKAVVL